MEKLYEYELDINSSIAPARLVRMVGCGKRVLEVGCSSGASSRALRDAMHCTVVGLEINTGAAAIARQYCSRVIVGNVETMDLTRELEGQVFDVITFGDVLEHLRDPLAALIRLRPFLALEGYIVVSVPNMTHFSIAFELLNGRFDYREKGLLDDTHVRFFTAKSLLRMLEEADLQPLQIDRVIVEPEATEFKTTLFGPEHISVFEYARKCNPEFMTYQFVVKAVIPLGGIPESSMEIQAREEVDDLKVLLAKSRSYSAALQSKIDWIEGRLPMRLIRKIAKMLPWHGQA